MFVALEEGFFAKYGLRVKLITPANAAEGEKMVAANQADIAITYQPALMYHVTHGLPIIRFATLIDKPLNCFIVLDTGKINSLKDLKGKKIGYSSPGIDGIAFSSIAASHGELKAMASSPR